MRACWMFMIIMGFRLSHATHPQSTCTVYLETVPVCVGANVCVLCPELNAEEVTFHLFKDKEMIFNCTHHHNNKTKNCNPPHTWLGVVLESNKLVSFSLNGVNTSSAGVYRCEGTAMYPPPLVTKTRDGILVRIGEHHCKDNKQGCPERDDDQSRQIIWVIPLVVLSIYSITISIVALVYWMKLRNADSHNDYINTKPSAPRGRGRKRGVQKPIRHF